MANSSQSDAFLVAIHAVSAVSMNVTSLFSIFVHRDSAYHLPAATSSASFGSFAQGRGLFDCEHPISRHAVVIELQNSCSHKNPFLLFCFQDTWSLAVTEPPATVANSALVPASERPQFGGIESSIDDVLTLLD